MSVNTTTSIDLPCRRRLQYKQARFRTQAHHLRRALARYPFIHSENFHLRLSTETVTRLPRGPMLNPERLGFTLWGEYVLL
jgi:hypothetical protein